MTRVEDQNEERQGRSYFSWFSKEMIQKPIREGVNEGRRLVRDIREGFQLEKEVTSHTLADGTSLTSHEAGRVVEDMPVSARATYRRKFPFGRWEVAEGSIEIVE